MTIPLAGNNWCVDCQSPCYDHASMCTTCGSSLGPVPPPPDAAQGPRTTRSSLRRNQWGDDLVQAETVREATQVVENTHGVSIRPIPQEAINQVRCTNDEITRLLRRFRAQVNEINAEQQTLRQSLIDAREEWQAIPPQLLELSQGESTNQGTSLAVLNDLPRTNLTKQSAMFYRCSLTLQLSPESSQQVTAMEVIPGEFGDYDRRFRFGDAILLVADPITGKRTIDVAGRDRNECKLSLLKASVRDVSKEQCARSEPRPVIVYFLRGGGLSFVEKAVMAQSAGAVACIIGNHVAQPWPFTMQDSAGTAVSSALNIPTFLVSQAHGQLIQRITSALVSSSTGRGFSSRSSVIPCSLTMAPIKHVCDESHHDAILGSSEPCGVCTEVYSPGHTIVTLPGCGHIFHQDCVIPWLRRHNTCPYCRHALPLQDEENERARRQNPGDRNIATPGASVDDFYG